MNPPKSDELLDFQSDEWAAGRRPSLESLLEANPTLVKNNELLLDLIYNEVILREQLRQHPQLSDYVSRFPQLEAELRRQFEVHGVMGSSLAPVNGQGTPPASILAGRYQTTAFHAAGGLGYVYRASDHELNRTVALKCMKEPAGEESPLTKRFLEEAEITSLLEHPTIVPVHGSGITADGRPYYAMRFVEGETLETAAKRLHAPKDVAAPSGSELRRLLRALVDVCNAVAYAHSKEILHRDLKPANILLGPYGETLLLDWGLAKHLGQSSERSYSVDEHALKDTKSPSETDTSEKSRSHLDTPSSALTFLGKAKGSPAFMSPEQARGDWQSVGVASDVYSLGATLYYLLTGQLAFTAQTSHSVLEQVSKGEFAPPKAVDNRIHAALSAITCKAMSLRPVDRYANAQELAKDLERWMADEPVSAHPDSVTVRAWRWARRHRTLVATCIVALVVASIGLAAGAWRVNVANFHLSQAKERESTQRELANQRFAQALDAQVLLVTEIQTELSKAPGTRQVRERLLTDAMSKLQVLVTSALEVEDTELAVISAHRALGKLYEAVDLNLVKANEEFDKAAALAGEFHKKHAAAPSARQMKFEVFADKFHLEINRGKLAEADASLRTLEALLPNVGDRSKEAPARVATAKASLAQTRGDHRGAIVELNRAKEYWRAADAENNNHIASLANVLDNLGERYYFVGDFKTAATEYTDSLVLWRELVRRDPTNVLYQTKLSHVCQSLGMAAKAVDRHGDAETYFKEAIDLAAALVAKDRANRAHQVELADAKIKFSGLEADRGRLLQALEQIAAAKLIYDDLIKQDTQDLRALTDLAHALLRESRIFDLQGKYQEAIDALERSAKFERDMIKIAPDRTAPHADLADVLRDLAQLRLEYLKDQKGGFEAYTEARSELEKLVKLDSTNVNWQHVRLAVIKDVAYWKHANRLPGVEETIAEGMAIIATLPRSIQADPQILENGIVLQRTLAREMFAKKQSDKAQTLIAAQIVALNDLKVKIPDQAFVWRELRTFEGFMASIAGEKKDTAGVVTHLKESVAAGRELERRFPDHDRNNQELPRRLEELADQLVFTKPAEALKLVEEAIARYDQITPEVAARYRFTLMLGVKCIKLANLTGLLKGNDPAVVVSYQKAASYFEKCTSDNPQEKAVAAAFLAQARCEEAEKALLLGDIDGARRAFEQVQPALDSAERKRLEAQPVGQMAIEWSNDYGSLFDFLPEAIVSDEAILMLPKDQRFLAMKTRLGWLIQNNQIAEAAKSLEWMAENSGGTSSISEAAARTFGQLYEKSNRQEKSYRDKALKWLKAAIEQGHLKPVGNKAIIQNAYEFRSFADSEEFKQLFAD
jgi:eukaryotic-like serine/threonine-protein kinase